MELMRNIIDEATNIQVYFIKKTRGKGDHTAVIFPNAINDKIKDNYRENFHHFTDEKGVREYDGVHQETDTIQKVPTAELDEWSRILTAISTAEENSVLLSKSNFNDDFSLLVIKFVKSSPVDIRKAYLVAKYRKTDTWYKKSVKYSYVGGAPEEMKEDIYILNGCIDAAISEDDAYILMSKGFESIFNYYKKSAQILVSHKESIEGWTFLDAPQKFYNCIQGKKGATLKMARVLEKSLTTLNTLTPVEIKGKLSSYEDFNDIEYDENNKIIVTNKNRDLIIDILLNVYAKNLFNDELVRTKGA